jgi:DNA-binding response OmpR family regulator
VKHILIIDDDIHIGNMLEEVLTSEGYRVSRSYSGTEALWVLSSYKPDLVLLDLMLPGLSGEDVLPKIKGMPVIVVSAKVDVNDKVDLLLGGAVDYVTKPFDIKELLARIIVQLRKAFASEDEAIITFDDIQINNATHDVSVGENTAKLTRTEYAILKLLMQNPAQVVTKSILLDRISHDTPDCTESSLKIHISNLRKKLREASGKEYIEAVWGIGFKLKVE